MNKTHIKKFTILLMIILTLSLTACGEEKKKLNSCEAFVKEQFQELYDAEVQVSEGKLSKEELSEEELSDGEVPDDIYFCKVKVADELYDAVVHIDEHGNMEMFTTYEDIFATTICTTLKSNEYWRHKAGYWGCYWGLESSSETIIWLQSNEAFDSFAEKLAQLDLDSFETAYFVRVEFMNERIIVPIREEYTAEDYREMLSELLPEVDMVERDSESKLMLTAELVNKTELSDVNGMEVNEFIVRYDGDLSMIVYTSDYGTSGASGKMSDYDYSLLRNWLDEFEGYEHESTLTNGEIWDIVYYDKSGNVIQSYCGYIDDSELLGDIINRVLYTYYKKWY